MSIESSLELDVIRGQIGRFCSFSLGSEVLAAKEPSFDPLIIRRDHERIKEALACTVQFGAMPFGGIHDLRQPLASAAKGMVLTPQELLQEMRLIQGIRSIYAYERSLEIPHEYLKDLVSTMVLHQAVEKKLAACINDYGEVLDTASSELSGIRRAIKSADAEISSAVTKFISAHASSVVDSIVTYRGSRAVILVKAAEKNTFGGLVYGDSASGQASYVEPASFVGPNNRKQELLAKEQEEIARILQECSQAVGAVASEEIANIETCGLLDALFASAQWGKEHNAVAAELTEQKRIHIKKARHPLIDPAKVVANDYHLEDPERMLLITGPNTGGKTVSLKIIGLFVLMTYSGMPVTAEEAEIPYFDHVFADIGDDQSVAASLSSFSAHIEKLAVIAKEATGDSLALLDEIGSGTDPKEGEALAIAVLNELRERGCMTIATTHYSRLKAYGKRHSDILLASVQFDMEKLAPTYCYLEGLTGQSNALEVAERYGLPKSVISYARFLKAQSRTEEDQLLERLEKQLGEAEQMKQELSAKLADAEAREQKARLLQEQAEKEKDRWQQQGEQEAHAYEEQARREADQILKEMREKQETARYHELLAIRQKLNRHEDQPFSLEEDSAAKPAEFAVGDVVELRSSGQAARITQIGRKDITIALNGRAMHVKPGQIRQSSAVLPSARPAAVVSFDHATVMESIPGECNLIGMHVDEALSAMGDYMDRVKLHHLKTCRIIHGDGTGALRKAVQQRLDRDPDVESWHIGMPQEGGTGATVVVMRD